MKINAFMIMIADTLAEWAHLLSECHGYGGRCDRVGGGKKAERMTHAEKKVQIHKNNN